MAFTFLDEIGRAPEGNLLEDLAPAYDVTNIEAEGASAYFGFVSDLLNPINANVWKGSVDDIRNATIVDSIINYYSISVSRISNSFSNFDSEEEERALVAGGKLSLPGSLIDNAIQSVQKARIPWQAQMAQDILLDFYTQIQISGKKSGPGFMVAFPEDGALLIEWQQSGRRFGVSFEESEGNSFWYLIDLDATPNIRSTGKLKDLSPSKIVGFILRDG
jgi:hypothetical protein